MPSHTIRLQAFTVVELVVVIATIAILAGVSTIAYTGWRTDVAETEVKHELTSIYNDQMSKANFSTSARFQTLSTSTNQSVQIVGVNLNAGNDFCYLGKSLRENSIYFYVASTQRTPVTTKPLTACPNP